MKGGAQAALALAVGYALGRRRKMRLATTLALGAATGGVAGLGGAALRRGAKYLGSTDIASAVGPQIGEIVSTIRGDLLDAGKAAAAAAVSSQIESLSENLHERAETLRNPEAAVGKAGETVGRAGETVGRAGETVGRAGETVGRAGETVGRLRRRGRTAGTEEDAELDQDEERGAEKRSNGRIRRQRPVARRSARSQSDQAAEPEDEYEEEEPDEDEDEAVDEEPAAAAGEQGEEGEEGEEEVEEPAPPRRRTARSPVTRTRR